MSDLKNAAGMDKSKFADLASLKSIYWQIGDLGKLGNGVNC